MTPESATRLKLIEAQPANQRVLAYLTQRWDTGHPENQSAPPSIYDLFRNPVGTHPDLADRIWKEISATLPEDCGWVIYNRVALIHPRTGVIFAFGGGTHTYVIRLPPHLVSEAGQLSPERVMTYSGKQKPFDVDALGPEWVLGHWLEAEKDWCLAAYEAATVNRV